MMRPKKGEIHVPATIGATIAACLTITLVLQMVMLPPTTTTANTENARSERHRGGSSSSATIFRSEDVVLPHRNYKPLYKKWATRIYPLPGNKEGGGEPEGCIAWRQTGNCDPNGPREAFFDKKCDVTIFSGPSGYCDCGNGVRKNMVGCDRHTPFTCADACSGTSSTANDESDEMDADFGGRRRAGRYNGGRARRGGSRNWGVGGDDDDGFSSHSVEKEDHALDSVVEVNGQLYPADKFLAARKAHFASLPQEHKATAPIRRVLTSYAALRHHKQHETINSGESSASAVPLPLWRKAFDVMQSIAALDASRLLGNNAVIEDSGSAADKKGPKCVSWRQTGGCNPHGKPEPSFDRPCSAVISNGMSGYCECTGNRRVPGVTCHHKPFTCEQMCDPTTAFDVHRQSTESKTAHTTPFTDDRLYHRPLRQEEMKPAQRGSQFAQMHLAAVGAIREGRTTSENSKTYAKLHADVLSPAGLAAMDSHVKDMVDHHVVEPTPRPQVEADDNRLQKLVGDEGVKMLHMKPHNNINNDRHDDVKFDLPPDEIIENVEEERKEEEEAALAGRVDDAALGGASGGGANDEETMRSLRQAEDLAREVERVRDSRGDSESDLVNGDEELKLDAINNDAGRGGGGGADGEDNKDMPPLVDADKME